MKSKKKVLIIDDDELSYFSISLATRSDFFEVLPQASNSILALKAIDEKHPDIILMDVRLDSNTSINDANLFTDGIEFAHYINKRHSIPIIFVTGFSDYETVSRSISKDFYGLLVKPVDKVTLQTALLSALLRFQQDTEKRKQDSLVNMFFDHNMYGYFLASYPAQTKVKQIDIFALIEQTRIERINDTLLSLLELEQEEIQQKSIVHLFDLSDEKVKAAIEQIVAKGLFEGRLTLKTHTGKEIIADVHCKRVNYLQENREVLLGMIRDISEQVKLQTQFEMLDPAVADIKESVIVTTAEFKYPHPKIIYVNRAASEMTGYSKEELLGQSPRILQGPLTDRKMLDDLKQHLAQGRSFMGRNTNYRKDGSTYIVEWNVSPVKNDRGEIDFFVSVQRDITKEVAMIQRIERDKELFQAMLNNSRIAQILLDEHHSVLIFNEYARNLMNKLSGKDVHAEKSLSIEEFIPPAYIAVIKDSLEKAAQFKHSRFEADFMILNQTRTFEFTCRKIGGSTKLKVVQFLLTGFDITEIKRANHELKEMNRRLEEMVEARTIEYKKAKEEAIESARVKERFLANMSHEIRTPINGIRGMVHLLQDTLLNTTQKEYLETIRISSDNLLVIINDILDIEKIKSGKLELEKNPFELSTIAENVQRLLQHKSDQKHIPIYFDISNLEQNALIGDTARIQQVVLNLVDNAIKFTLDGEVLVRFISIKENDNTARVLISVKDSGIGMSEEQTKRIFSPFVQADPTINRRFGGTGLGLSISRRLVEMMGGSIQVKSEKGKGSEFTVSLKLSVWNNELPRTATTSIEIGDYSGFHFLLVDDNRVNLLFLKRLLDKWNVNSDSVESGLLAIDLVRNIHYDLIFLDIQMPEMDGYEVCRFIREELKISKEELPIIALTADVLSDQRKKMEDSGMNGLITKPFDPKDIKQAIETYLVQPKQQNGKRNSIENSSVESRGLLSFETLNDMAEGDMEFKRSVLEQFHLILTDTIAKLPVVNEAQDVKQIRGLIHRIKPNLGYFGLNEIIELCKRIMSLTAEVDPDMQLVSTTVEVMLEQMIRVELEVQQELAVLKV